MGFNSQQELAINTIDKNVCVIAGAGTGKTAVLTHRFINIIKKSKLPPDDIVKRILAITFTNKATNEMVERIGRELMTLEKTDDKYKGLQNSLPFINVSTIDSFCQSIIRENSFKIGLDIDYKIIQNAESNLILEESLKTVFDKYLENNKQFKDFLIANSYIRKEKFVSEISGLYRKIQAKGYDFDEILFKNPMYLNEEVNVKNFLNEFLSFYNNLLDNKKINKRHNLVKDFNDGIFIQIESEDLVIKKQALRTMREDILKISDKTDCSVILSNISKMILSIEKSDIIYYEMINSFLKDVDKIFKENKKAKSLLEFSDLLYYTNEILKYNDILDDLKEKYHYIMIDEFQDTNRYQRDIFYKLASNEKELDRNNLFVVGDPKQSIYGFRGSDLSVFKQSIKDIKNSGGELITLYDNYRSTESIVEFTNNLFQQLMNKEYSSLNASNSEAFNIDKNKKIELVSYIGEEYTEADLVAMKILELRKNGKDLDKIAVLFRATSNLKKLEEALTSYNIPFINPKSKDFYNKREILDIILFLKFINDPNDSECLYGLLRSNFFIIDDNTLFNLSKMTDKNLYKSLLFYNGVNEELNQARIILQKSLELKDKVSIYELLNYFVKATNYIEVLALTTNTRQEVENIKKFQELVYFYEEERSSYLNEFLDYLIVEEKDDENEAVVVSKYGAVSLMTIHASKGLDFDSVLFYDSKNKANREKKSFIVGEKYGYGIKIKDNNELYSIVQNENYLLEQEERRRLLYVCVTRAKEDFVYFSVEKEEKNFKADGQLDETSFYTTLKSLDYVYNINKEFENKTIIKNKYQELTTNEKEINIRKPLNKNFEKQSSSISAYNVYERCPREFYYRYKLFLKDIDDYFLDDESQEAVFENNSLIKATSYGSLVHLIIENYDKLADVNELIEIKLKELGLTNNFVIKNRLLNHINNYKNNEIKGEKYFEFDFLIDIGNGYFKGAIDQVIFNENGIYIVDFKTNYVTDIEKIIKNYNAQLRLYAIVIEKIFGTRPQKAYLNLLEINKLVEVPIDKLGNERLLNRLNLFLRFISDNDSIEKYACCQQCHEYCKFKSICSRELNDKSKCI